MLRPIKAWRLAEGVNKKPEEIFMFGKLKALLSAFNNAAAVMAVTLILAVCSLNSYIYDDSIQVHINVDGVTVKTVNTKAGTVKDILEKENIFIEHGDAVSPSADTKLLSSGTVSINKLKTITVNNAKNTYEVKTSAATARELEMSGAAGLKPTDSVGEGAARIVDGESYDVKNAYLINVYADGGVFPVYLSKGTVNDAIKAAGLTMDADDLCYPLGSVELWDGIEIKITRVATVHSTQSQAVPYETQRVENIYLKPAEQVVTVAGVDGEKRIDKVITYHDGKVYNEIVTESLVRPAVDEVVEYGVWNLKKSSLNTKEAIGTVNGQPYSMMISATATAYCDKGITASGLRSQVGVVAVDPRVIPLGTRLYIESADGTWSYGVCVAGDTGGAIKGNIVDLFYDSYNQCIQFGRRGCNIYVLAD